MALSSVMADQYASMALQACSRLLSQALNVLYSGNTITSSDTADLNRLSRKPATVNGSSS